jgi:hypothetical protein
MTNNSTLVLLEEEFDENQVIRQIADENKRMVDGTVQNFKDMIESNIFEQSNYKDFEFDQWLQ